MIFLLEIMDFKRPNLFKPFRTFGVSCPGLFAIDNIKCQNSILKWLNCNIKLKTCLISSM